MPGITLLGNFWLGWVFILFLTFMNRRETNSLRFGLFSSVIYSCVYGVNSIIRYLVDRPRPFVDHDIIVRLPYLFADISIIGPSFPSGTTATAFALATLAVYETKILGNYRFVFYVIAGLVGFSRVYLGLHYPSDVVCGAILGYGLTNLMLSNHWLRVKIVGRVGDFIEKARRSI
jgi:undecaprenyl-diphosphatase